MGRRVLQLGDDLHLAQPHIAIPSNSSSGKKNVLALSKEMGWERPATTPITASAATSEPMTATAFAAFDCTGDAWYAAPRSLDMAVRIATKPNRAAGPARNIQS